MQPKISVIVPVYKAEKYLHRCVDSILSQTFTDFELILVNDGSPDNSGAICDEYAQKDNRVHVFHKKNGGVALARNLGLDNAKGKWITFIDADDYIEDGFLNFPDSTQEDLLIQNYKVIEGENYDVKFENSTIPPTQIQEFINQNIDKLWLRTPWSKFFKRGIIDKNTIRFTEGVKIGEDTIFVLDYLFHINSVHFLNSANYIYISEGDNVYNKYKLSAEKAIEAIHLFIERYNRLKANSTLCLRLIFMFYWSIISPKDYASIKRWKSDRIIKQTYHTIRHRLDMKWKIKYYFLPLYTILRKRYAS